MAMASNRNPVGNRIGAWICNKRESVHIAVKRVFSGRQKLLAKSVGMSELEPNYDQNQALGALIQIVGSSISIIGLNAQKWAMDEQAKMDAQVATDLLHPSVVVSPLHVGIAIIHVDYHPCAFRFPQYR